MAKDSFAVLFATAAIALTVYLTFAYALVPLWRRHKRYTSYSPLTGLPTTTATPSTPPENGNNNTSSPDGDSDPLPPTVFSRLFDLALKPFSHTNLGAWLAQRELRRRNNGSAWRGASSSSSRGRASSVDSFLGDEELVDEAAVRQADALTAAAEGGRSGSGVRMDDGRNAARRQREELLASGGGRQQQQQRWMPPGLVGSRAAVNSEAEDTNRRLSRELEAGFRDDSEDEEDDDHGRRGLMAR